MAPRHVWKYDPDAWWKDAYKDNDKIHVAFEFQSGRDTVRPGMMIRFKNMQGTFRFRCLAHNIEQDSTWIDCIENKTGMHRAFPVEKFKTLVKPKKSRRKKANA